MKKYFLIVKSLNYFLVQKCLGYHFSVIYKKLHKLSHWGTQETLKVTQETFTFISRVLLTRGFRLAWINTF